MFKTLLHKTMLTAIAILLGGWAVVAQQYVVKGTSLNFNVENNTNYQYHWSVTNTSTGTVSYLPSKTNQANYTFAEAGIYEVKVYPEDLGTRCFGDALTMRVEVDQTAPTAVFDKLDVPYVCAETESGDGNSLLNVKVIYTGPKPWTFKYSLDRGVAKTPVGANEIYNSEFEFEIQIPNNTGAKRQAEILLVEAQTLTGIPVVKDLPNQTLIVDVETKPLTQFTDYESVALVGSIQAYTARIEKAGEYQIFVPAGATVLNEQTSNLSGNLKRELRFDVQWGSIPGNYQVKLLERSPVGCLGDTVYADVRLVESFTVSLGDDLSICKGQSKTLTPEISFGGNYTYLWSDGTTGSSLQVTQAGTYTVTATHTETGNSSSASVRVTELDAPVVNLGDDYQLANGEEITLDAGNPGMAYAWSTGETTQSIKVSTSNTYSVTVTNNAGCTGSDEIVITSAGDGFAIDLGTDKNICQGDEITLNPNPSVSQEYTYLWSNGANTPSLTVSESGTYTVTVRSQDGKEQSDEVLVTVHPLPIVDLGEDIVLYDGETAELDAGDDAAVYEWNTGAATRTITVSEENVYSVKVTSEFGCSNTDAVNVVRREGRKFSVDLGGNIEICEGDRIYLEPTVDRNFEAIYKWIPSESAEKGIFVDQTGKYCVEVTDPFGNTEGDCVELTVNPSPVVDLGDDIVLQVGETVDLDAENEGSFYRWSTNEITQVITVDKAGEYWVEVTNQKSCMGRDTVNVEFPNGDQFVGLPTGFSPNGDGKNDVLYVRGNNIASMSLIIYNRLGHKIFQSNRQDVGWDGTYRGQKQDMDVYVFFLKVTFLDGSSIQKRGNVTLLY